MTPIGLRLAEVASSDFLSLVGSEFAVADGSAVLTLIKSEDLGSAVTGRRTPFELVFRGPTEPALAQGLFALKNAAFGELEIFLVPVGIDAESRTYQAIFN